MEKGTIFLLRTEKDNEYTINWPLIYLPRIGEQLDFGASCFSHLNENEDEGLVTIWSIDYREVEGKMIPVLWTE